MMHSGLRSLGRMFKAKILLSRYQSIDPETKVILYPLHFHPESSTSVRSANFLDEYEVIKNIAFNLPQGYTVVVKDHPSSYGYPSLAFYKKIFSLPNVVLVSPFLNTKNLIKRADSIITLSSTVGYEALVLGKRVFLFGEVFYGFHKNIIKINCINELSQQFHNNLSKACPVDKSYTYKFVLSYFLSCHDGLLNYSGTSREQSEFIVKVKTAIAADFNSAKTSNWFKGA